MSGTYPSPEFQSIGIAVPAPASGVLGDFSNGSVTATSGTASRTLATSAADVTNVLNYGAVTNTGVDSAPAINGAITASTYGDIFLPSGSYRVNGPLNLKSGQTLRGASDHSTVLYVDQQFSSSGAGVIITTGFDLGGNVIRDLTVQFQQPPDIITTTTAATAVGGTTITVASTAGIAVGNYAQDVTATGAIPVNTTTVTAIAGNVLTLSAAIVAPGVGNGDSIHFGFGRSNMLTIAAGGTSGAGGTGIKYPPAIYINAATSSRVRLENLSIQGAWDGIYGVPNWITNIEMGALDIGWNTDGIVMADAVHVKGWHNWPFGLSSTGSTGVYHDGQVIAWNIGRIDGLNVTGVSMVDSGFNVTSNASAGGVPWTIQGLNMDGNGANLSIAGGTLRISGFYSTGTSTSSGTVINVTGGSLSIDNGNIALGGTLATVVNSGGTLKISNSLMFASNGSTSFISLTGGITMINSCYIQPFGAQAVPLINQTGGVIVVQNNFAHVGTSGTVISVGLDNQQNTILSNSFPGYTISLPAPPISGTYQQGAYGSGTAWGQQLSLGSLNQGGRLDFRRWSDGQATAWIGMSAANAANLALTSTAGSSQIIINGNLADVFQVNNVEVGRFDANGIGAAKVTAAAVAPGAGFAKLAFVAGTNAGTGKLVAYCGTSTTPVTIMDNIGAGF